MSGAERAEVPEVAALEPHRLAITARAATVVAGGGRSVSVEDEDRLAQWFGGIVDEAIRGCGLPAAAIWLVLAGDSHADPWISRSAPGLTDLAPSAPRERPTTLGAR